jgi:hypothetical protein
LIKRDHLGNIGTDGRVIKTILKGGGSEDVGWTELIQNRVQWLALKITVMKFQVP